MDLSQFGLPSDQVEKITAAIESGKSAADKWSQFCSSVTGSNLEPNVYRKVWVHLFADWNADDKSPAPMWFPSHSEMEGSNLASWMNKLECDDYESFRTWAANNRAEFWDQVIKQLNIQFETPAESVLDLAEGAANAKWLPGSRFNIGQSCFQCDDNEIAIIDGSPQGDLHPTTYAELNQLANRVANGLVNQGLKPGDAVAVVMPMTALSVAIYLGMVKAGISVVSIADSFAPPEIENRLRISKAKALFTYDCQIRATRQLPLYETVQAATELPAFVIPFGDSMQCELREQDIAWSDFLPESDQFTDYIAGPDHIVNILFSSGTTGDPKAIPWTQLTPIKCAADGFFHHNLKAGDVVCWPTNLGWMMGPWLIFAALMNRGTIALFNDTPVVESFGRFVQNAKVNMLGVVPTIVRAWRNKGRMEQFDWSSIKVFSSTGESSQADDMFYLSSLAEMKPVIEYCGGTEIGGGYISSTVVQPNVPSAFSSPAIGLDIVLLDEENQPSDSGELYIVPPSIGLSSSLLNRDHFETYFADTPSTAEHDVLRRHGDHMTRLAGSYYIAGGRVDDTMNLGGIKTSSAELERVMNQIDGVKETAAVAVAESGGPNSLVVFAVLEQPQDESELLMNMNKLIRSQLNPLFKAKSVHVIESMPRTASGKVMRRKLRAELDSAK